MSDRKPIILAASVGALALAANGTAAAVAISASPQPEAIAFGAIGLAAAFIALVTITLWACADLASPQQRNARRRAALARGDSDYRPRARVFTPWSESSHGSEALAIEPIEEYADETEEEIAFEETAIEPVATPAGGGAAIIYLADWLKTHERRRAHA